jgi:hypothetical protein
MLNSFIPRPFPVVDTFTRAYLDTMLWASTDDSDNPLDDRYSVLDIASESLEQIIRECEAFQLASYGLITEETYIGSHPDSSEAIAGHDFFLTRNGHGAGFWDGDWKDPESDRLDKLAEWFGESDPYVGDDCQIHVSPIRRMSDVPHD